MSEKNEMIDVKSIATRVVVRGLISLTTEERDELLSWEQAAYAAEEANERCADLLRHQAEADRAIRALDLSSHGGCESCAKVRREHASAIQRARSHSND